MTSPVDICSNALVQLGAMPINSFTSGGGERAILASNVYPMVRDKILRSHPWNACIKRVMLAPDVEPPAFGFRHRFLLPGDWLRTLSVGDGYCKPDYVSEGGYILCDQSALLLRYIFRNENPATWDSMLINVMTQALIVAFAYPITKSTSKQELEMRLLMDALKAAKAVDGQEDPPEQMGDLLIYSARF